MEFNLNVKDSCCRSWVNVEETTSTTTNNYGSFRIYTNRLAKFFWETLRLAKTIQINGQSYCVDLTEFSIWANHHQKLIQRLNNDLNPTAKKVNAYFIGRQEVEVEEAPAAPTPPNPEPPPPLLSQPSSSPQNAVIAHQPEKPSPPEKPANANTSTPHSESDEKSVSATVKTETLMKKIASIQQDQKASHEEQISDEELNEIIAKFPNSFSEKETTQYYWCDATPQSFFGKIASGEKLSAKFLARIKRDPNFCRTYLPHLEIFCSGYEIVKQNLRKLCEDLIKHAAESLGIHETLPFFKMAPLEALIPLIESQNLTPEDLKELDLLIHDKVLEFVTKLPNPIPDAFGWPFSCCPKLFSELARLVSQDQKFLHASVPLVASFCERYNERKDHFKENLNRLVAKILETVTIKEFMAFSNKSPLEFPNQFLQLYEILQTHRFNEAKKREIVAEMKNIYLAAVANEEIATHSTLKKMGPKKIFDFFDLIELTDPKHLEKPFVFPIATLLFLNPKELIQTLKSREYFLKELTIHSETLSEMIKTLSLMGIPRNQEADLASCIEILAKNQSIGWKPFVPVLRHLIKSDLTVATNLIAQHLSPVDQMKEMKEVIEEALTWDASSCFNIFLKLWGNNFAAWDGKEAGDFLPVAKKAAENGATKCLSLITGRLKEEERIALAREYKAFPEIVVAALNDNKKAAALIFEEMTQIRESWLKNEAETTQIMRKCVTKMLRLTTIENTENLFQNFIENCSQVEKTELDKIYKKIKRETLRLLPFISRHNKPKEIKWILIMYSPNHEKSDIDTIVAQDFDYAKTCRKKTEELLKVLQEGTLRFEVPKSPFENSKSFPPSQNKTRYVAMLLEKIALFRANKQAERKAGDVHRFAAIRIRNECFATFATHNYEWASPLISSVFHLSKSAKLDIDISFFITCSYALKNKNGDVAYASIDRYNRDTGLRSPVWGHGVSPIENTWPYIEDLFDSLFNRDLSPPKMQTVQSLEEYRRRLNDFYFTLAKLLGCVGKTQPLFRGSGTVEEFLSAILHLHHGLAPPILRPSFPQYGVLDITFPDYEPNAEYPKFFTAFFDPDSLPKHASALKLPSGVSLYSQMEALYQQI